VSLWPSPQSKWLLRNRRYVGVAFAVSHTVHLIGIIAATRVVADFTIAPAALYGGGLAYVFIALMTATSFDRTARWLGRRWWSRLHKAAAYYIWFIFAQSYLPRAAVSVAYVPFGLAIIAALGLRIAAARSRRTVAVGGRATT